MRTRLPKLVFLILLLLVGCAGPKPQPTLNGEPVFGLVVKDELIIPGGSARTRFQEGHQTSRVDRFTPFCSFEVNTVSERPQTVSPGSFAITGVYYRVVADSVTRIPLIYSRDRGCDDPTYPEITFRLRSDAQADVRSLTCLNVCIHCSTGCYYLWPDEIQSILGPRFTWDLSDQEMDPRE